MSNLNGIHHVVKLLPVQGGASQAYCGRLVYNYDMPIEVEHAKRCVEQGTYLQPCKNCMTAFNKGELDNE